MSDSSDEDGDFGQKLPPLHIYLKRVLDKYPEGGQILKELVQNADDAEAKNVIFLYDKSQHPSHQLWSETLKDFQGPALYAYNDATFQKQDWYNIQHPEQSGKLEDLSKVGRFGLGFISVYHLTDMPCIISGSKIGFLDPLEKHFIHDTHTNTRYIGRRGKKWKMSANLLAKFPNQFSPYLIDLFHCNHKNFDSGHLEGTIFRFPFRTSESLISKSVFTNDERVRDLFASFQRDAEISLLFLKHVESITVYERDCCYVNPKLICKVQIHQEDRHQLRLNRTTFLSQILSKQDIQTMNCVRIQKQTGSQTAQTTSRYITLNTLKNNSTSRHLQELSKDEELKLLPWMGMSFRVSSTGGSDDEQQSGRVFCFLPLPESEETGLPVHVHGYFGLGDNRRSIKWPDQESQHDNKALWNELLTKEVFPEVYAKVILSAIQKSNDPSDPTQPLDVYRAWPSIGNIKANWLAGVKNFLQLVANEPIFYTEHNGGYWMKPTDLYVDPEGSALVSKVLRNKGCPVTQPPNHVLESLRWAGVCYHTVTPALMRICIRGDPLQFLSRNEKCKLLTYVTNDTVCDLNNLFLLPLQNGDFVAFSNNAPKVYIATTENPSSLILNGASRFAASDLPSALLTDPKTEAYTQLKPLGVNDVAPLLKEMLPSTWRGGTDDTVPWTPGRGQQPTREWFAEFWRWLVKTDLEAFRGIPLIPVARDSIARLQQNRLICQVREGGSYGRYPARLSDNICSFLESIGAVVIRDLPSYVSDHPHVNRFVSAPTPEGVMTILEACSNNNLDAQVQRLASSIKDDLRALLAKLQHLTTRQSDILKSLPFFLGSDEKYVSVKTCPKAVPGDFFGLPVRAFRRRCLILGSDESDNLLLRLDVQKQSVDQFLQGNVLPAVQKGFYSDGGSLKIMKWVLEQPRFDHLVTGLKFIPISGCRASPKELFEPSETLQVLFRGGSNKFPVGQYSEGRLLNYLKRIGLKSEANVTPDDVLRCAKEVSQTTGGADVERGSVLLQHINCYPAILSEQVTSNMICKALFKFLEDLSWVPCEASPPADYPKKAGWIGNSHKLYSPRQVGLIDSALIQGSVLPLVGLHDVKSELLNVFGWQKNLDSSNYQHVERVVLHLKNVANNYQNVHDNAYSVALTVSTIYSFFTAVANLPLRHLFNKHMSAPQPWVWHGFGFTTPDKMALSNGTLGVTLTPHLRIVPQDYLQYRSFLNSMGVQETFQDSALCEVLKIVSQKHEASSVSSQEDYETDLNLVCNILRHIVNHERFDNNMSGILVPCRRQREERKLHMACSSQCLYVDEERLARQIFEEGFQDFDRPICHELIPNWVAQKLGLKPLSHVIAPVEAVQYGYDVAGPHETTVNAIKRNLDMYKEGPGIFNELIQNADDAGATEVKFLLDWRENKHTAHNLLGEGMKSCHGPALWAHNDGIFSKDDITNICNIAAQSKKDQLDKVGRFGLGFTSVYHLTDVPSVVSGPYVLICDPRTTHLGSRVKPWQPGIKLDLTNESHRWTLDCYPNQFQPYNGIFGCKLPEAAHYEHTLFRLPLRTKAEADGQQPNQISDSVFDSRQSVEPLLKALQKSVSTLLLFTQNVACVTVEEFESENIDDRKPLISVTVSQVRQLPRSITVPADDFKTQRGILKATAKRVKVPGHSVPVPETTMLVKITLETCVLGVGTNKKPKEKAYHFILSSCMATGKPLDLALTKEGIKSGVMPCGGVAAQLLRGLTPETTQGKAFSYLPLDVSTGLRFHVNGNFLLQPNRRQLWSKPSSDTGEFETRWNICFMESVLLRAFTNLLKDLQILQEQDVVDARNFQCLWPRRSESESDFHPFVNAFYRNIGSSVDAPEVFFDQRKWVSVHQCFFTDWTLTDPDELRRSIKTVLNKHQDPKRYVELERDIVDSIRQADAQEAFDYNTFNIQRFLSEVFFPMLENYPEDIESIHRNKIVLHMLDLRLGERKLEDYDKLLKATECIPTSPEGEDLARPRDLVNPESPVGSLYSETDCRFPHGELYRKQERLLSLSQLGMASLDLSWDDICERAQSLSHSDNIDQRCITLLKLIDEKLRRSDKPTADQTRRIRQAAFLPVLKKPPGYPIDWFQSDDEFMPAAMLHTREHKNLLGSARPLLDENRLGSEAMSDTVKTFLGFTGKQVAVGDVIVQLGILIDRAPKIAYQTSAMVHSIYSYLQSTFCTESLNGDVTINEEHRDVVDQLSSMRFVFCDGQFRECRQLAFLYEGKNGPYLYKVSHDLIQFSNLLRICDVRDQFQVDDFRQTLQLLKDTYGEKPLNQSDLKNATSMLSEVVSMLAGKHGKHAGGSQENSLQTGLIYVPDKCGVLRLPDELTYNDMEWEESRAEEKYTHPSIPSQDAKGLGIITRREKCIDSWSLLQGFATDFGQSEELTDRLKNILRSYPNVSDVFKELLQNADDAGSTEIHFVYDPRHHEAKKVICDSWAAVGELPSLCVYNDKPFTEADIKGIQRVGVGGKRDDIATTGKFGIGFNAVYHLTDCPSFLSNSDTLCVFDPLLMFSPATRNTSPGIKLPTHDGFKKKFPDMWKGYLEDIPFFNGKGGTVFRFPLRKQPSVLSRETYFPMRVEELLGDFKKVSQEALLFLNNIKSISVSCIDEHTNKLTTEYCISAKLSQNEERRARFTEHLKRFTDNPSEKVEPMSHVYTLVTSDSLGIEQTWLISQRLGFKGSLPEFHSVSRAFSLKRPLPRAGVAALLKDSRMKMAPSQMHKQPCKAYCFLPLPVYTGLPVHVNGTFELDSARKNLAKCDDYAKSGTSDERGLIHRWNRILVEYVLTPAYAKLIEQAGPIVLGGADVKSLKQHLCRYDDLFPKHLKMYHGEWELLAKATLQYIGKENLKVLPVVHQTEDAVTTTWHHPNSDGSLAFTDNFNAASPEAGVNLVRDDTARELIRSFLLRVNFNLLASSPDVCLAFQACGVEAKFVNPKSVVQHVSSGSHQVAQALPAPLETTEFKNIKTLRTVFEYCLEGIRNPAELNGLPIRLTSDGMLREFSTCDGSYVTDHSRLLPCLKDIFLHSGLVSSCIAWFERKGNSMAAYSSGVFKQFTITELAKYLGKYLPERWQGCTQHVEWTPDRKGHPSKTWLGHLWAFICSETLKGGSLDSINHWPIFPTTSGKLVPPSLSKTVLLLQNSTVGLGMQTVCALRKLGLPEIATLAMCELKPTYKTGKLALVSHAPPGLDKFLEKHLALPKSRQAVTSVINYVFETGGVIGDLTLAESNTLLQYFQEDENLSRDSIRTVKRLPVFRLLEEEKTTDLHHFDHYHTAEGNGMLMVEAKTWMDNMSCVILEPNRSLVWIYKQLGITPITQADMYLTYILPSFQVLSQNARLEHFKFIINNVIHEAHEQKGKEILKQLSHIPFIPDETGILRHASFFYDGANRVFNAMIDPIKLLPESMGNLKHLLEKIGFHSRVTQDYFLQFARDVEKRAVKVKDKEKWEKLCVISRILINELDMNSELRDPDFLKTIATIKFVPSVVIKSELLQIHPSLSSTGNNNNQAPAFIAYKGSMSDANLKLTWTACMVLPREAVPTNYIIGNGVTVHSCLGIETSPIADKVILHTQNICGQMEKWNAIHKEDMLPAGQRETLKEVMGKILGYLKDLNMAEHGGDIKRRLKCTPVCLVEEGRVLVRADQLVFKMDQDLEPSLRPYLYKAPRELAQFDTILRLLGAQESCSLDQLAGVLASMKVECGRERLDPNEKNKAVSAVRTIFRLLRNERDQSKFSVSELYLPNAEYFLRRSTDLYYADPNQMEHFNLASTDREFILPFTQCGFGLQEEMRLVQFLPEFLRPKNLGNEINEKPLDTNEDCPAGQHCDYLEGVKRKVKSEEMTRVLLRLTQHQLKNNPPSADIKERITQLQQFDKFVCKAELKLGLYDNDGQKIAEQQHSRSAYFEKRMGIIYLEHSSLSQEKSLTFGQIAKCCNVLLGGLLDSEHQSLCADALDCQNLAEMNTILSKSDISEYDTTTPDVEPDEHRPGTLIPRDIYHLLDHDPYNRFLVGDIVGYERDIDDADQLQYDDNDDLAFDTGDRVPSETPADGATEKIYATILEQIDKSDETVNLSKRFKIDIGEKDPIIVKVTTLYKFLRPKKQPDMTVVPFTGEPTSDVPSAADVEQALPEDMQEIEEQIKKEVDEVFRMPLEERKKVLYRLYRKWHPDKNPGQQERASQAFQFLKQEIERHERDDESSQRCSDQYSNWESDVDRDREEARKYQEKYYRSQSSARSYRSEGNFVPPSFTGARSNRSYGNFVPPSFTGARSNRSEGYFVPPSFTGAKSNRSYGNFVPPSFTRETPDLRQARLWFRQAKEHLKVAEQTSQHEPVPTQWIAFQLHQAAETALKAAQYSLDGHPDINSNDLISLARTVCRHRDVISVRVFEVTLELVRRNCDFTKPRYPQRNSKTSGQEYSHFSTADVLEKCKELLNLVQEIIGIRLF
ncbi:sacsin-like [Patiria miniata]|uniref:HEPN domain-containing protein n=1 Tax=Patiria miniata TaxID=46514 RepID=A0A914ACP7_PATMI|nr:sacsin-like [Patiria miniata]